MCTVKTLLVHSTCALCRVQALEEARLSIENQLKEAQELNKQLEARMAETEREKQELHEEKIKAVENVEKHVRKQILTYHGCNFSTSGPFSEFEFHVVQAAHESRSKRSSAKY